MACVSRERFIPDRWFGRKRVSQGASRCQVGSLVDDHGVGRVTPVAGSIVTCCIGDPRLSVGVPRIVESSGDHSQAAQHAPFMTPGYRNSTPAELPSAGITTGRTSSYPAVYPRRRKSRVPSFDHSASAFQTASGGIDNSRSPVPSAAMTWARAVRPSASLSHVVYVINDPSGDHLTPAISKPSA